MKSWATVGLIAALIISVSIAEEKITFEDHILPILDRKCLSCHNPDKAKGGLDLTTYDGVIAGGSGGDVVQTEDHTASRLYTLMAHTEEPYMPPRKAKAPDRELQVLAKWINKGLLATSSSTAKKSEKPKLDMSLVTAAGKPEGPAAMPQHVLIQPEIVTKRPATVTALAHSPWAPIVAIAGQKQVLLYHSKDFDLLGILPFPEGFPQSLSFSSSGALLQAGGGRGGKSGSVVAWDVNTGERVIEVGREFDIVLGSDISPNHREVVMGGPTKTIKIWDTVSGEQSRAIKKHPDWMLTADYSPDGILFGTGGRNGGLYIWESSTGIEFHNLKGHTKAVTNLAWRPDSNTLASISEDGQAMLWEMNEGSNIKKWNAHSGGGLGIDFSADGSKIATVGRDKKLKLWKADGAAIRTIDASQDIVVSVVFTDDNQRVITGDYNGVVKVWGVESGQLIGELNANPPTIDQQIEYAKNTIVELRSKLPSLEKANAESQTKLETAKNKLKQTTDLANQLNGKKNELSKKSDALSKQLQGLEAENSKAKSSLQKNQALVKEQSKASTNAQRDYDKVKHELNSSNRNLTKAQQHHQETKLALDRVNNEAEPAKELVTKKTSANQKASENLKRLETRTSELGKQLVSIDIKLKAARSAEIKTKDSINTANAIVASKSKEISELAKKVKVAKDELAKLNKEIERVDQLKKNQTKTLEWLKNKQQKVATETIAAKADLERNQFFKEKYKAAAINYEANLEDAELSEMSAELGPISADLESAKHDLKKASQARVTVEANWVEAKQTIQIGNQQLQATTEAVLEKSLQRVASQAAVTLVEEAVNETSEESLQEPVIAAVSESLATKSPDEIQAEIDQLHDQLEQLNAKIEDSFNKAEQTKQAIDKASDVAAKSPDLIQRRRQEEQDKARILAEKEKLKQKHEQAIAKQQNLISELKEKYLKAVPERK